MHVLAFVNQKGGTGKTTCAVNLAGALVERGARTLVVDLDPQEHATAALGVASGDGPSALDVLRGTALLPEAWRAAAGGVWLVPSSTRLLEFEEEAEHALRPESRLGEALRHAANAFDVVLVDCPPRTDGVLCANALRAADTAVLVVETGAFALQGAIKASAILAALQRDVGRPGDVRVLATLFDRREALAREVLVALHARFAPALFETVVRTHVRLREAAALGAPIQVVDPGSSAAVDFRSLADEVALLVEARESTAAR